MCRYRWNRLSRKESSVGIVSLIREREGCSSLRAGGGHWLVKRGQCGHVGIKVGMSRSDRQAPHGYLRSMYHFGAEFDLNQRILSYSFAINYVSTFSL